MSKMFTGSICLTDLIEKAKSKHSSFVRSQTNNKIYCNLLLWENEDADKYGNTHSLQLNSKKEMKETEDRMYIGNFKPIERKEPLPVSNKDVADINDPDDLPF